MNQENNKREQLMMHMHKHLDIFTREKEVVAVTLNGGLSRGYGDELSEVDLTIFLTDQGMSDYQSMNLRLPSAITVIDKQLYDIKIVAMSDELNRVLSPLVELWDFTNSEVLYDPEGKVKQLKDKWRNARSLPQLGSSMFDAWWHIVLAGDIWDYREDYAQGHLMLNQGAKALMKSIYLVNDRYVPHDKWLYHDLSENGWLPKPVEQLMEDALIINDFSKGAYLDRQARLLAIYHKIDHFARHFTDGYQKVDVTMEGYYRKLKLLLKMKEIPLDYALSAIGSSTLQMDPFSLIVDIIDDKVVLNEKRLAAITAEDMYEWHYQVLVEALK